VYNPFAKLKQLFSRKKKPVEQPLQPVEAVVPVPVEEPPKEEFRKQVTCAHCGAPNDSFVKVCWMCKKELIVKMGK
jgi:hypothetical protein